MHREHRVLASPLTEESMMSRGKRGSFGCVDCSPQTLASALAKFLTL